MENLSLTLADGAPLTVKSFIAREALSAPFDVEILAYSQADNLPFEAVIGHKATFRVASPWPDAAPRAWTGVVQRVEQIDAEATGATTYAIHLAPALWRLSRRTNCRIYQHLSIPEIARALLAEWDIEPVLRLDPAAFPRHEYRVQYGETDLAFLSRLLEEAGIAYLFDDPAEVQGAPSGPWSALILAEDASRREPRAGALEFWNTKDLPNDREVVGQVRASREARAGRATLRDHDWRQRPKNKLLASAVTASEAESRIEQFEYVPGAFVVEPAPGGARVDEREAQSRADKALAAARGGRFAVTYRTNVLDLSAGVVFSMHGHPHPDLGDGRPLLVTGQRIEGHRGGEWTVSGEATFGDEPHRPARRTPKPRIAGVQSAFVVGPAGEEIHTDAMGRVRVELPWDREGKSDERSSCFLRVSQAWAGPGYGIVTVPRVGEEVIVSFFEGDPDQPVITGRVHNGAAPPPEPLPANKTMSVWRSLSSPGGGGYNEIALDDRKGEELVTVRAQRDYERNVLREERAAIGASLTTSIGESEARSIKQDQRTTIGGDRSVTISGSDTLEVGESLSIDLGGNAGGTFSRDKRIVFTTGEASLVLDGPNLYIDAKAIVSLRSGDTVSVSGGDVHIDGQPNVSLNAASASPPAVSMFDGSVMHLAQMLPADAPPLELLDKLVNSPLLDPGLAPGELSIPPEIEAQLAAARNKVLAGVEEVISKIESLPDLIGQDLVPEVEAARAAANARIEQARKWLEQAKARAAEEIAKLKAEAEHLKAELMDLKARGEAAIAAVRERIQQGINTVKERVQETVNAVKERIQQGVKAVEDRIQAVKDRIQQVRDQARQTVQNIKDRIQGFKDEVKSRFDQLRAQAIEFRNKVTGPFKEIRDGIKQVTQQVKDTVAEFKQTINRVVDQVKQSVKEVKDEIQNVKNAINDVKNEVKKAVQDVKGTFNDVKQEVKDTFNDVKHEVKDTVNDVKKEFNDAKDGVKNAWNDAKHEAKDAVNDAKKEAKDAFNDAKKEAKDAFNDAKGQAKDAWNDAKGQAKDAVNEAKNEAKGAVADAKQGVKDAVGDVKGAAADAKQSAKDAVSDIKNIFKGGSEGADDPGSKMLKAMHHHGGSPGSDSPFSLPGSTARSAQNPLLGSTVVTRAGGFTPEGMAAAVNGSQAPTLLQSPGEGQLLVLRTQQAAPISHAELTHAFVEGQMDGLSSSDAYASALEAKGYLVYERPWDSALEPMLKKAVL